MENTKLVWNTTNGASAFSFHNGLTLTIEQSATAGGFSFVVMNTPRGTEMPDLVWEGIELWTIMVGRGNLIKMHGHVIDHDANIEPYPSETIHSRCAANRSASRSKNRAPSPTDDADADRSH
jgi:hypothetical protein